MRRTALALVCLVAAVGFAVAGCGGEEEATPTPETVTGTIDTTETDTTETETETETETTDTTDTGAAGGDPVAGKQVFISQCATCHTLADAGTTGTIGPNLDDSQPSVELVLDRVTNGQGAMPSFADTLSEQQIADVAAYVSQSAGG